MASYPSSPISVPTINQGDTIQTTDVTRAYEEITAMEQAQLSSGLGHNLFPDASANGRTLGTSAKFWGLAYVKGLAQAPATELTVASGAVTITQGVHTLDTESDGATDDLNTLNAGTGVVAGMTVLLYAENVARVVTLKDGGGNLLLNGDYELSATDRTILLYYDGTNWREIARSGVSSSSVPRCRVTRSATQSISTSTDTAISYTASDVFDTDTMHDTSSNQSRITFTTAGTYMVGCDHAWESNGNGKRWIKLRLNGSTVIASRQKTAADESEDGMSTFYAFSANDYVEVVVYQTSGSALNIAAGAVAWAYRVSA